MHVQAVAVHVMLGVELNADYHVPLDVMVVVRAVQQHALDVIVHA